VGVDVRKSSGKFKSWELGREQEEEDARQSVKDVNKRTTYSRNSDHTSYLLD
jgi:hypothetical protein